MKRGTTMTAQTTPSTPNVFTFEQLMELFRDTDRKMQETDRKMQETDRKMQETDRIVQENARQQKETDRIMKDTEKQIKATNKKISELGDRVGELIETIVEAGIVRMFRTLGYSFTGCARWYKFDDKQLDVSGEIDLFLENGILALLAEIKMNLTVNDIKTHVKRMEKYRKYADARNDKRQFLAAVGGGVVRKEVQEYAMKHGIYVIIQSGESVEIAALPKGFKAKIW
jgi:hypothetical protein